MFLFVTGACLGGLAGAAGGFAGRLAASAAGLALRPQRVTRLGGAFCGGGAGLLVLSMGLSPVVLSADEGSMTAALRDAWFPLPPVVVLHGVGLAAGAAAGFARPAPVAGD